MKLIDLFSKSISPFFKWQRPVKKSLTLSISKYVTVLKLYTLLILTLCVNSCKKDTLVPNDSPKTGLTQETKKNPIQTITYKEFLAAIDINKTGVLKQALSTAPNDNQSINSTTDDSGFVLDLSNVKKLVNHDTISYVISLKPKTPRAVHFENITIQTVNGQVKAFLTTYLPTKEWIEDWRTVKHMAFKGDIFVNNILLSDVPDDAKNLGTQSIPGAGKTTNSIVVNKIKINLAPGECETYDVYEWIPVQCSTGDWPGDCIWENEPFRMHEGDYPPGYIVTRTTVINCAMPGTTGPIGGGGGGGGTTPNPPGDYNPCGDGPTPVISSADGGLKVLQLPPSNCDPTPPPPPPQPTYPVEIQSLINFYNLQGTDRSYVINNQQIATELYDELVADDFTLEGKAAALMTIKAGAAGTFSTSNYNYAYTVISSALPNASVISPQSFSIYMAIQCAIIRSEHPEYPFWRVYWEASKEVVHLLLDGAGLVPGVGEIADLANGVIYTIEGDGVNASLSYASAIPVVGWFSAGVKFAKKTIVLSNGTKTTLKWAVKVGNKIHFGDRGQLRKVLNLAAGDLRQAHHVIPWAQQTHRTIEKAAKSNRAFHMNSALNGIPLNTAVHSGSHSNYDKEVIKLLEAIDVNLTPEQTAIAVENVINRIKNVIINNPNTHINNLVF